MLRKRTALCIAISFLLTSLLLIFSSVSFAETDVGRVTHLSGPLFAIKADGTMSALSINSAVEQGDTLITEKKTYARIKFTDNSEMTLRPGAQLKVSQYNFDQDKPKEDNVVFNLIKGGMRSITGMIGKRSGQDSYRLMTATAVIGVRGTTYECKICEGNCGSIPNGLYLFVLDGIINVSNNTASQDVNAGQYAYVLTADSIPKILPGNPGLDLLLPTLIGNSPKEEGSEKVVPCCVVR